MPLLGNGIFTQDGEAWKHSRAILRPQFSRGKITDLEMEEGHVRDMMSALPFDRDGWTLETDLQLLPEGPELRVIPCRLARSQYMATHQIISKINKQRTDFRTRQIRQTNYQTCGSWNIKTQN